MEKRFRITVDGREYQVTVEDLNEGAGQLYPQPDSMKIPTPPSPAATSAPTPVVGSNANAASAPGDVTSNLGGVVQAVLVSVGQQVSVGDRLAVVEAMKMKTPIISGVAGKVTSVAVKAGDPVEAGQVLMTIA
ncbi:MAG: biotin/lipoyl-binding protein [Sulfuritalea sp.]|nr:biotin/lipoyl-binding protein [Sulfuritalea sp.]